MKCKKCESCFHKKVCSDYSDYKTDTLAYMGVSFEPEKCKDYVDISEYIEREKVFRVIYKLKRCGIHEGSGSYISGWHNALEEVRKNITD